MQHRKEKKMQDQQEKEKKKKMERGKISSKKHTEKQMYTVQSSKTQHSHSKGSGIPASAQTAY